MKARRERLENHGVNARPKVNEKVDEMFSGMKKTLGNPRIFSGASGMPVELFVASIRDLDAQSAIVIRSPLRIIER